MTDVIYGAVIFGCGAFIGFLVSGFFPIRRAATDDFDGGYLHDNRPRAITRITKDDLEWEIH